MLASFEYIINSKVFPFDCIVGVMDWKHEMYSCTKNEIIKLNEKEQRLIPVFLINGGYYVPKMFNKANRFAYPGMKETNLEIFSGLSDIKFTTIPILTEIINDFEYGLIKWFDNSSTLFELKDINMKDIAQIIECGLELSIKGAFHLDLNFDNIIKDDRVYFIDPSIAKNHFRPKHNYFNERAISYHWAPELINGGQITEKSSIYSVGKTIKFCCRDVDLKVSKLIDLFLEEKPINRPSFSESYSIIKEII